MGSLIEQEISIVLKMHRRVILSGGVCPRSYLIRSFIRHQLLVLEMLKLPATTENIRCTVTYPVFNQSNSLFCEALCRQPDGFVMSREPYGNKGLPNELTKASLMEVQVEFVYNRLKKLVEQCNNS